MNQFHKNIDFETITQSASGRLVDQWDFIGCAIEPQVFDRPNAQSPFTAGLKMPTTLVVFN